MTSPSRRPRTPGKKATNIYDVAREAKMSLFTVSAVINKSAALLKPIFDTHQGRNGRLSIQTDPRLYRNTQAIVEQAAAFDQIASEYDREDPCDQRRNRRY